MKELNLKIKTHRVVDYFEKRGAENPVSLSYAEADFADMGITGEVRSWIYAARRFMEKHRGNTIVWVAKGVYQLGDKAMDNFQETERHGRKILQEAEARGRTSRTIKIKDLQPENQLIVQAYVTRIEQSNENIKFNYRQIAEATESLRYLLSGGGDAKKIS